MKKSCKKRRETFADSIINKSEFLLGKQLSHFILSLLENLLLYILRLIQANV